MSFDVARVRGLYPTLGVGAVALEGPAGALQPEVVIRAIITTLRAAPAQPGSRSGRSRRSAVSIHAARAAVADLVGGEAQSVIFGGNEATLMLQLTAALSTRWQLGEHIVVNRLDQDSDLRPLLVVARAIGMVVKWAEVDLESGELPDWQYDRLVTPHTRLVTVPLANPSLGTVPNVRAIADRAHADGALVLVNAGVALPHLPIDIGELGADFLEISVRGFGGPTVSAIAARPGLLRELNLHPSQIEFGALPVELMDGVSAAVDHLAGLDDNPGGTRRQRIVRSLTEAGRHERPLYLHLDEQLRAIPAITVLGSSIERVPVVAFAVKGLTPDQVADHLARNGVAVWTGHAGQSELLAVLGADELGGPVHVGIMPHNTFAEVEQLLDALRRLTAT